MSPLESWATLLWFVSLAVLFVRALRELHRANLELAEADAGLSATEELPVPRIVPADQPLTLGMNEKATRRVVYENGQLVSDDGWLIEALP